MFKILGWSTGILFAVSFFAFIFFPYPYGSLLFILSWILLSAWGYFHWKDDYAPGGLWVVGAIMGIGATYIWDFIAPYLFPNYSSFHATSILATHIIQWILIAMVGIDLCYDYFRRRNWHRRKKWDELSNAELPWLYIWNARCWGRDTNSADDKTEDIDGELKWISGSYQEMKRRGIEKKILERLLTHKDDGVRAMAARHLYWGDKERSMHIFEEIGAKNNLLGEEMRGWAKDLREGKVAPDPE
jgi:hypothetical protein